MSSKKVTKDPKVTKKAEKTPAELGGQARAEALSPSERSEIARRGAEARWAKVDGMPKASHEGMVKIGDIEFPCSVLDDKEKTRVLSETKFMEGMGMYRSGALSTRRKAGTEEGSARMPLFLAFKNLKPYISRHLPDVHAEPLMYRTLGGNIAHGIPASLIPKICEVWLDARADNVLGNAQKKVAATAELLLRGLAQVGIIALVDEATGFQEKRDRDALQAILDRFLRQELAAWAKRFPDEFYRHIFRLRGWQWKGMSINRPHAVANYTKDVVYARLAPGLLKELEDRTPRAENGRRKAKFHQWMTDDVGHPALAQHLHAVVGLMRVAGTWDQFMGMLNVAFPKRGDTLMLPFMNDDPIR